MKLKKKCEYSLSLVSPFFLILFFFLKIQFLISLIYIRDDKEAISSTGNLDIIQKVFNTELTMKKT